MNRSDLIDVLTAVSAGTGREIGEADVALWQQVLTPEIPAQFAIAAVVAHFRDRPGVWLEPGHIVERWRAHRRDILDRQTDTERQAYRAAVDARILDAIEPTVEATKLPAKHTRPSQRTDDAHDPLRVRCPWCRAGEFRPCQIPGTNVTMRDPHPSRVEAMGSNQ